MNLLTLIKVPLNKTFCNWQEMFSVSQEMFSVSQEMFSVSQEMFSAINRQSYFKIFHQRMPKSKRRYQKPNKRLNLFVYDDNINLLVECNNTAK